MKIVLTVPFVPWPVTRGTDRLIVNLVEGLSKRHEVTLVTQSLTAEGLDRLFGLSQRLWYLALPSLGFLPSSVEKHLELVEAIKTQDGDQAERIMREHVKEFYAQVRKILQAEADIDSAGVESADIEPADI